MIRRDFFYKPIEGYTGDFIPYYENGLYYLYFLYDHRNTGKFGEGTSWYLLTTKDFVHYQEHGEVLPHGDTFSQDLDCFTGSVTKIGDSYFLYYTGYNNHPEFCRQDTPLQAVMLARSSDLIHWEKCPHTCFYPSDDIYELYDWRDPYLFWNEEKQEYWMLLAARVKEGPKRRRGCIGLCTSGDGLHWDIRKPFYAPGLYMTHECPEVFCMGDWWYLIYSSFSERFVTHYRMARSPEGPWQAPGDDSIDGRAFYAGKTAGDGQKRYIFGWIPTKEHRNDYENYEWAGNLIVHELVQNADGTLRVKIPDTVAAHFNQEIPVLWRERIGNWDASAEEISSDARDSYASIVTSGDLPLRCKIEAQFSFSAGTKGFGLILRSDASMDTGYYIRWEPHMQRMVFDMWPRKEKRPEEQPWQICGDKPYFPELERMCPLDADRYYPVTVLLDDTMAAVYVDQHKVMSLRIYNIQNGKLGLFVSEGAARFRNVKVSLPGKQKEVTV